MGDIFASIFGTSGSKREQVQVDPIQRAFNMIRLNQAANFFTPDQPMWQWGRPNAEISTPTEGTQGVLNIVRDNIWNNQILPTQNLLNLDQYRQAFQPVSDEYNRALTRTNELANYVSDANYRDYGGLRSTVLGGVQGALGRNYGDYGIGVEGARQAYNQAIARGDFDLAQSIGRAQADWIRSSDVANAYQQSAGAGNLQNLQQALGIQSAGRQQDIGLQEALRQRALDLGIGATGNYIDQIATPRLNAALTLQGLESGGAVPAAIARATAETAMPYLQGIEQLYGGNIAGLQSLYGGNIAQLLGQYGGLQAQLGQAGMQTQADLANQLMSLTGQLSGQQMGQQAAAGQQYAQNINQLAQALMSGNISLEQAGIAADSALGQQLIQAQNTLRNNQMQQQSGLANTMMGLQTGFAQTLPAASQMLSMLPLQQQGAQLQNLAQAAPLLDFPRQLQEADYLRRQNMATTMYTGLPFQTGTQSIQKSGTGNIFDQLGGTISSGVTGGSGGFSTLGTKF